MIGGMILGLLFAILWVLGFAYAIWVLASKESGMMKLAGQIIAILVVILMAVILIFGGLCGQGGKGMCPMMSDSGMSDGKDAGMTQDMMVKGQKMMKKCPTKGTK